MYYMSFVFFPFISLNGTYIFIIMKNWGLHFPHYNSRSNGFIHNYVNPHSKSLLCVLWSSKSEEISIYLSSFTLRTKQFKSQLIETSVSLIKALEYWLCFITEKSGMHQTRLVSKALPERFSNSTVDSFSILFSYCIHPYIYFIDGLTWTSHTKPFLCCDIRY